MPVVMTGPSLEPTALEPPAATKRRSVQLLCPTCGEPTEHRHLFVKNGCGIFRCRACGLGRADAGNFVPDDYYTADYFSGKHPDGYADYSGAEPILRREFARTVSFIRQYRAGGSLLEIGCAYGFFLEEASRFYDVAGIEMAGEAGAYCRQRGFRVATGAADERTLAEFGKLDVVVLLDVIEHLPDPRGTLALCCRQLNPDGIVVFTTGDFSSLYARAAGRHWRLMTPPQHLWYFTPESVRRMSTSLGLTVEACTHPWKVVPLSLIGFQLRRMIGLGGTCAGYGGHIGIPVNLRDAMRCVLRKPSS